jgi:hypothetical protein
VDAARVGLHARGVPREGAVLGHEAAGVGHEAAGVGHEAAGVGHEGSGVRREARRIARERRRVRRNRRSEQRRRDETRALVAATLAPVTPRTRKLLRRAGLGFVGLVAVLAVVGYFLVHRAIATRGPGDAKGGVAVDFALPDATGKTVTLAALTAQGPAVLVFYRGYW